MESVEEDSPVAPLSPAFRPPRHHTPGAYRIPHLRRASETAAAQRSRRASLALVRPTDLLAAQTTSSDALPLYDHVAVQSDIQVVANYLRPGVDPSVLPRRVIHVAVDGSVEAHQALEWTLAFYINKNADEDLLELVTVRRPIQTVFTMDDLGAPRFAEYLYKLDKIERAKAWDLLTGLAEDVHKKGFSVRAVVITGDHPGRTLCAYMRQLQRDAAMHILPRTTAVHLSEYDHHRESMDTLLLPASVTEHTQPNRPHTGYHASSTLSGDAIPFPALALSDSIAEERAAGSSHILIVGSRGRGRFKRLFLGSTAHHCAKHAVVPAIVIRWRRHHLDKDGKPLLKVQEGGNKPEPVPMLRAEKGWRSKSVSHIAKTDSETVHPIA